mmetsp:Transcript_21907/g.62125  ORF Transcript_21907/g.62125 Transcript_21907/m.62125 type:complete len:387 (-) Transcript_21907:876-2036(-)
MGQARRLDFIGRGVLLEGAFARRDPEKAQHQGGHVWHLLPGRQGASRRERLARDGGLSAYGSRGVRHPRGGRRLQRHRQAGGSVRHRGCHAVWKVLQGAPWVPLVVLAAGARRARLGGGRPELRVHVVGRGYAAQEDLADRHLRAHVPQPRGLLSSRWPLSQWRSEGCHRCHYERCPAPRRNEHTGADSEHDKPPDERDDHHCVFDRFAHNDDSDDQPQHVDLVHDKRATNERGASAGLDAADVPGARVRHGLQNTDRLAELAGYHFSRPLPAEVHGQWGVRRMELGCRSERRGDVGCLLHEVARSGPGADAPCEGRGHLGASVQDRVMAPSLSRGDNDNGLPRQVPARVSVLLLLSGAFRLRERLGQDAVFQTGQHLRLRRVRGL